jgi:hypothetical protein
MKKLILVIALVLLATTVASAGNYNLYTTSISISGSVEVATPVPFNSQSACEGGAWYRYTSFIDLRTAAGLTGSLPSMAVYCVSADANSIIFPSTPYFVPNVPVPMMSIERKP